MPLDPDKYKQIEENHNKTEPSLVRRTDNNLEIPVVLRSIDSLSDSQKNAMLSAIVKTLLAEINRDAVKHRSAVSEKETD